MDDIYAINVAKTEYREAFNTGDVHRLLSVFGDGFADFSVGEPSFFGAEARNALEWRVRELFARYEARLAVIIIDIQIFGNVAYDWGWHELTLTPKTGGDPVTTRQRYMEVWQKGADGKWRIAIFINNADLPPQMLDERLRQARAESGPS
ncbi:MAG TPA: nuclear transport factor 2 family protein [Terriglobales bacterium]|nr:nuclear transport factor 2 family protein [Terriglobales bacterium]